MSLLKRPVWKRRLRAVGALVALVALITGMAVGMKSCVGSERRTVANEMVLKVLTPPPEVAPPPPPPPEEKPEEEPEPDEAPEPADADAPPAPADGPAAADAFGTGTGTPRRYGTGFGRPQDYLRQEMEKCLRKDPQLARARIRRQVVNLFVGADRRVTRAVRAGSTGRDETDRLLDERINACLGGLPEDSRFAPDSRFTIEINR